MNFLNFLVGLKFSFHLKDLLGVFFYYQVKNFFWKKWKLYLSEGLPVPFYSWPIYTNVFFIWFFDRPKKGRKNSHSKSKIITYFILLCDCFLSPEIQWIIWYHMTSLPKFAHLTSGQKYHFCQSRKIQSKQRWIRTKKPFLSFTGQRPISFAQKNFVQTKIKENYKCYKLSFRDKIIVKSSFSSITFTLK